MEKMSKDTFKEKIKNVSPNLTLLEDYINQKTKILVQDSLGIQYKCYPQLLLRGEQPSLVTAIDKNKAFAIKGANKYDNFYTYEKVNYINNGIKVIITCPVHGDFEQTPASHLFGYKCQKCGYDSNKMNFDYFIKKAISIHKDKYDYSKVSYTLISDKVKIICKEHGEFKQTVDSHLQGAGCPTCKKEYNNGYSRTSWTTLCNRKSNINPMVYIIRCFNLHEEFIKVGLTQNSVHRRFYGNLLPYSYEILKEIKGSPDFVFDEEKRLHKLCKEFSYMPKIYFEGRTECFTTDSLKLLI